MNKKSGRWYRNKKTGLPTIRRHPDARTYQTPNEVKRMISGQESDDDSMIQGTCALCGDLYHLGPCNENLR